MVRDIGADFDRFKRDPKGGHFAMTTAQNNGFQVKQQTFKVQMNRDEILPIGRPLWVRETGQTDKEKKSKKVIHEKTPAGCQYNIKREFDPDNKVKSQANCLFGLSYKNLKNVSYKTILTHFFYL